MTIKLKYDTPATHGLVNTVVAATATWFCFCWLLAQRPRNILVYLRDRSANAATEIEVSDQIFYLTQSQNIDTGPTCSSADPITSGAWQGSHWSANVEVTSLTRPRKIPSPAGFELRIFRSRSGHLKHLANEAVQQHGAAKQ